MLYQHAGAVDHVKKKSVKFQFLGSKLFKGGVSKPDRGLGFEIPLYFES